jgi:hypothetical protein
MKQAELLRELESLWKALGTDTPNLTKVTFMIKLEKFLMEALKKILSS